MNITLNSAVTLELPLQTPLFEPPLIDSPPLDSPPLDSPPLDSPLIGPQLLVPAPVRTGSVVLDDLLARQGFGVGQPLHLRGGGLKTQHSILLGWIGATIARRESCVLFDLEADLTENVVERAGLKLIRSGELAAAGLDVVALGDAKGYCRVAQPSTWDGLGRGLNRVFETAGSPTLVFVSGLDRLISNHIGGRATPTNLIKARTILGMLKKYLAKCEASAHTVVFAHSPGGKGSDTHSATGDHLAQPPVSPALRRLMGESLFGDFALGLELGRARGKQKCGKERFIEVPVQPKHRGLARGRAGSIELWQGSGRFKNG